jgi:hypothetical protein
MYFLVKNPSPEITDNPSGIIKEAIFGSANFTMNGTGRGIRSHASNRKFEVVARIEDSSGRENLWKEFLRIWWNADEEDFDGNRWIKKVRYK